MEHGLFPQSRSHLHRRKGEVECRVGGREAEMTTTHYYLRYGGHSDKDGSANNDSDKEPGEISSESPPEADHGIPIHKKRKYSQGEPAEKLKSESEEEILLARDIARSRWADTGIYTEDASPLMSQTKRRRHWLTGNGPEGSGCKTTCNTDGAGRDSARSSREDLEHCKSGSEFQDDVFNKRQPVELDEECNSKYHSPEICPESDSSVAPMLKPPPPLPRTIDMLQGCRTVDEFEKLKRINEGTYGVVYKARNKKSGEIVALKKVKLENASEGFPITSLREINLLMSFRHPSIVAIQEVVVGSRIDSIFMVMEYMEHDLRGFMEAMKQPFSHSEVKCLMLQLLQGVNYLHDNWVLHRDLKTSNLLFNNRGELKICDFGLARQFGSPLRTYTHTVVSLWYRAPELLLGATKYSTAIDMWSVGCIMAELLSKKPLFDGRSELDQIDKIFWTLGTPNEKIWPDLVNLRKVKCRFITQQCNKLREKFPAVSFSGRPTLSERGFDLLNRLLTYDPAERITSEEALKHEWFFEAPLPKTKDLMPMHPVEKDRYGRWRTRGVRDSPEHKPREGV